QKLGMKKVDSRIKSLNEEFLTKMKYVHAKSNLAAKNKPD
ncbi:hypothetical protein LSAT2_008819, partial [Lamellibrachia satsuma]